MVEIGDVGPVTYHHRNITVGGVFRRQKPTGLNHITDVTDVTKNRIV